MQAAAPEPRPAKTHLRENNRAWGKNGPRVKFAYQIGAQALEELGGNPHTATKPAPGVVEYGYRHYSPGAGRWISRDPIGEAGGLNLFGMLGNDAVNSSDYLGLAFNCDDKCPDQCKCGPNLDSRDGNVRECEQDCRDWKHEKTDGGTRTNCGGGEAPGRGAGGGGDRGNGGGGAPSGGCAAGQFVLPPSHAGMAHVIMAVRTAKAKSLVEAASAMNGSRRYGVIALALTSSGIFCPGDPKCNQYVADSIARTSGMNSPMIRKDRSGNTIPPRIPLVEEWGDRNISIPGFGQPHKNPSPGDVVFGSNHMGIRDECGVWQASSTTNTVYRDPKVQNYPWARTPNK